MRLVKWLLVFGVMFAILLFGIKFGTSNNQTVSLRIPGGWETQDVELWQLVLISAGVGAAVAFLIFLVELVSLEASRQKLNRRVKALERELTALRNLPLSDKPAIERPRTAPGAGPPAVAPPPAAQPKDASS
jgi:uncharacterized membrane protein YciS (DUF1049 family)